MKRFDQINVIPFIDIMLVLLAIVLTTATFISQGQIEINLPTANSAEQVIEKQAKKITITVNAENQIYLEDKQLNLNALSAALKDVNKDTQIVFRVDKQVVFEKFVQIIDLLKTHKLEKFSIITIEQPNRK